MLSRCLLQPFLRFFFYYTPRMKKILLTIAILVIGLAATEQLRQINTKNLSFSLPDFLTRHLTPTPSTLNFQPSTRAVQPPLLQGSEEERRVQMIAQTLPSVVTIGINFIAQEQDQLQLNPGDIFGNGGGFRRVPGRQTQIDRNIGSGFIVSATGLVITNKHVVEQLDAKYKVRLNNGDTFDVEKIYRDPLNDLAILKISPKKTLTPLPLGDSAKLKLGQTTVAVGTPLGEFTNSITTGVVSGLGRGITAGSPYAGSTEKLDDVIQTDAAISPGNSGGPLLNSQGEVIGINTAVSGDGQNIGFAIPVNLVKTLLGAFEKRGGSFERPYIGIQYQMIDRSTAIVHGLVEGAYIQEVVAGSPAERAGLAADDVVTRIDGQKISGQDEQTIIKILLDKKIGQTVQVSYWRDGAEKTVAVVLEKL